MDKLREPKSWRIFIRRWHSNKNLYLHGTTKQRRKATKWFEDHKLNFPREGDRPPGRYVLKKGDVQKTWERTEVVKLGQRLDFW